MRAFVVELMAIVDRVRVAAVASFVAGAVVLAALLAGNPSISVGDGAWIVVVGLVLSAAYQVFSTRRAAGRPDAGAWGMATGIALAVAVAAFWALSILFRPAVETSSLVSGNQVALAVVAWALLSLGAVLWARGRQHRTTALALAVSMGAILGGAAGLRAGETWTPVALLAVLVGMGVFTAAVFPSYQARFGGRVTGVTKPDAAPAPARAPASRAGTRRTAEPRSGTLKAADSQPAKRTSRRPRSR